MTSFRPFADVHASFAGCERDGGRIVATYVFAAALPIFADHFPGAPSVPGCYLLCAVADALGRDTGADLPIPRSAERVRWKAPVAPGETLRLELLAEAGVDVLRVRARATVGGEERFAARLAFAVASEGDGKRAGPSAPPG